MSNGSPAVRPRLSVAIIARDAEFRLARTIRCVQEIADEIVVLDTGSTDHTCALAKNLGARVNSAPWTDDFSAARNACLQHVTGEWVLWLDAGEWLDNPAPARLREFVDRHAQSDEAYLLLVKTPPQTPGVPAEQVARVRLVPGRQSLRFAGRVCETLLPALRAEGMGLQLLPWPICRGEEDVHPETKMARAQRNLRLATIESAESAADARLLNCMGEALAALGRPAEAAARYREAIGVCPRGSTAMLEAYYGLLTALEADSQAAAAEIAVCLEALEVFPLDAQLLCVMGGYLQRQGRLDLAIRAYETAHRHGVVDPQAWHLQETAEFAAVCYSVALQLQSRFDEAQKVLEEAIERSGTSERLRRQMIDLQIRLEREEAALGQIDFLPADTPQVESLRIAVRGACHASGRRWQAAEALLEQAYDGGCRDLLCLKWLGITRLARGRAAQARIVLEQWRELEPHNVEIQRCLELADEIQGQSLAAA